MVATAVQLYTLRAVEKPLPDILEHVAAAGYDGVEFAYRVRDAETDTDAVLETLDATGLDAVAAHVSAEELDHDLDDLVTFADRFDCDTFVLPYLDDAHFASPEAVESTASELETLADRLETHGIRLCYHNHDHEFVDCEGTPAFERLLAATDDRVSFEVDLGWVAAAGHDPVTLLDRYGERIPLVHAFDVDESGDAVDFGDGIVDVPACMDAARDAGVEWAIYENDDPADPLVSIERGAAALRNS
ncbi:sugar phosphate isomerase/epimerase family protein [Haloarchaeobius sp. DFWS5]|uniref:sugar phosphate isomerase/epimerase family protein n=1 Tax=Haloarchaeobius sp. DFWS5 TaxID=3446114 RepID=UPI003EBA3D9E